ncbi:MAG: DegT/DnrJ/EryC1/StrS family aminotransferase, partial [Syntrophales bacterium LBB04]|nr:DegT/DnrJ/EryC1/StrS family aminotransferase [Syntrophales bacterium LBB04]
NKILNTSGGGMLASDDRDFIEQARFLSQQARDPFPHYEHSTIGYNYRMSNILAAIGRGQLRVLDERVEKKRWVFDYYRKALKGVPGIEFMPAPEWSRSSRWLTVILITPEEFGTDRETVRLALESENIESRPVWKPMHLQPVFRIKGQNRKVKAQSKSKAAYKAKVMGGDVAEDLFNRGLCLPSGTQLTEEDLDRIIRIIRKQHQ